MGTPLNIMEVADPQLDGKSWGAGKRKGGGRASSEESKTFPNVPAPLSLCFLVVVHLMTPLIPLSPPGIETPTSQPERIQRSIAMELLQKAAGERQASHGLLLASMENSCKWKHALTLQEGKLGKMEGVAAVGLDAWARSQNYHYTEDEFITSPGGGRSRKFWMMEKLGRVSSSLHDVGNVNYVR